MGLRAGLDRCGKSRFTGIRSPGPSSPLAVAIPTTLLGPLVKVVTEVIRMMECLLCKKVGEGIAARHS